MMIDILDLPKTKKIIASAEQQILANTGVKVKLVMQGQNVEHDIRFRKQVLQKIVCNEFLTTWDDVLSISRKTKVVAARHTYIYMLRTSLLENVVDIGRQLNRDHTSILHALNAIKGYYDVKDEIVTKIENVKKQYNDAFLQNENKPLTT